MKVVKEIFSNIRAGPLKVYIKKDTNMKERLKSLAFNLRLIGVILLKLDCLTFFLNEYCKS